MNQEPFVDEKPPKTWGEWKDKKKQQMSIAKGKAQVKAAELKEKAKERADKVDKESIKSKFGGFWKKIKRGQDNNQEEHKQNDDGQENNQEEQEAQELVEIKKVEDKGVVED